MSPTKLGQGFKRAVDILGLRIRRIVSEAYPKQGDHTFALPGPDTSELSLRGQNINSAKSVLVDQHVTATHARLTMPESSLPFNSVNRLQCQAHFLGKNSHFVNSKTTTYKATCHSTNRTTKSRTDIAALEQDQQRLFPPQLRDRNWSSMVNEALKAMLKARRRLLAGDFRKKQETRRRELERGKHHAVGMGPRDTAGMACRYSLVLHLTTAHHSLTWQK